MIFFSILYLVSLAAIITIVFSKLFRVRGPWNSFWSFFVIVLLAIFATDLWINPIGPYFNDIYWLPPLIVGLVMAFLLAATNPPVKRIRHIDKPMDRILNQPAQELSVGFFFWFFLLLMILLVGAGLLRSFQ